jgi:predicted  nucleic acid-binding Zn-ribbon protein
MEMEIHVLLDIEADKSRNINSLEVQLQNSEASERSLQEKLTGLTENFANLESHITLMKDRLD